MGLLSDDLKDKIWNSLISFVADQVRKQASEGVGRRVESWRTDRALARDVRNAVDEAFRRLTSEYPDRSLANTLRTNARFLDLPSVQQAVRDLLVRPFDSVAPFSLEISLADVLPSADRNKAGAAAQFFLERLREELVSAKSLHDMLNLVLQLETLRTEQQQNDVLDRIEELLRGEISTGTALSPYLAYVIATNTYIDPRGTTLAGRPMSLKLDEVYVSLRAEPAVEANSGQDEPWWEPYADILGDELVPFELAGISDHEAYTAIIRNAERALRPSVKLSEAVRDNPHLVVLGHPGAGKTTLVRFLALRYALAVRDALADGAFRSADVCETNLDGPLAQGSRNLVCDRDNGEFGEVRLPILIRVANYADAFTKDRSLGLRDYLCSSLGDVEATKEAISSLLQGTLQNGNALVLLDGLDEIVEAGERGLIAGRIEEFLSATNPRNRVIATSRVAAYQTVPLGLDFVVLTLQELGDQQIEEFLRNYCKGMERLHDPTAPESEIFERVSREVNGISKAFTQKPGVRLLAGNPLMLKILAMIHRNGAQLPARRVELYQTATRVLLEEWQLARGTPATKIVKEHEAVRLLGPIAYWIHCNRPSGIATEREVKDRLAEALQTARNLPVDDVETEEIVDDFLRRVRESSGIFVEQATGKYGFLHLTFQEYFAARFLVRRKRDAASMIYAHRHQLRWREPVLLSVAFMSTDYPDDASELIRCAILADGDEAGQLGFEPSLYEDVLHRDLILAGQCLADSIGIEHTLRQRVAKRLMELSESGGTLLLRQRVHETLSGLSGSETGEDVARELFRSLRSKDPEVRANAAETFRSVPVATPQVVTCLLGALADEDLEVRRSVLRALGSLGQATTEVRQAVIEALDHKDSDMRFVAVFAIEGLNLADQEVTQKLQRMLSDSDPDVRRRVIMALIRLKVASAQVIEDLRLALRDKSQEVRWWAAQGLVELGDEGEDEAVSAALENGPVERSGPFLSAPLRYAKVARPTHVRGLLHEVDGATRESQLAIAEDLVSYLERLPGESTPVFEALTDDSEYVRLVAAAALMKARLQEPHALSILLSGLVAEVADVRVFSAQLVGQLRIEARQLVELLEASLSDENPNIAREAISSVARLPRVMTKARADVRWLLRERHEDYASQESAGDLRPERSGRLIEVLFRRFHGNDRELSLRAASVLIGVGAGNPEMIEALLAGLDLEAVDLRTLSLVALERLCAGRSINLSKRQTEQVLNGVRRTVDISRDEEPIWREYGNVRLGIPFRDYAWGVLWRICDTVGDVAEKSLGPWDLRASNTGEADTR